jgi:hypothetical protein
MAEFLRIVTQIDIKSRQDRSRGIRRRGVPEMSQAVIRAVPSRRANTIEIESQDKDILSNDRVTH